MEEKRKVGRPKVKTEPTKTINVAIPITTLEKMKVIKICFNNNMTEYINKLIEKDINENYEKYKTMAETLENMF